MVRDGLLSSASFIIEENHSQLTACSGEKPRMFKVKRLEMECEVQVRSGVIGDFPLLRQLEKFQSPPPFELL